MQRMVTPGNRADTQVGQFDAVYRMCLLESSLQGLLSVVTINVYGQTEYLHQ